VSNTIRAIKRQITAMPGRSIDPRVFIPPDHYQYVQSQIESQQRQSQRNVSRTIRQQRGTPSPGRSVRTPFGFGPVPVIPLVPR
jgi:hypothetical protein